MFAGMEETIKEHVSHMLELNEYFNSHGDSPIQLIQGWLSDDQAPKWGNGRISSSKHTWLVLFKELEFSKPIFSVRLLGARANITGGLF